MSFIPGCRISACRVISLDPGTGLPELGEQRTGVVNGLVDGIAPDAMLAEFDWIARPPEQEFHAGQFDAATEALGANSLELPDLGELKMANKVETSNNRGI